MFEELKRAFHFRAGNFTDGFFFLSDIRFIEPTDRGYLTWALAAGREFRRQM